MEIGVVVPQPVGNVVENLLHPGYAACRFELRQRREFRFEGQRGALQEIGNRIMRHRSPRKPLYDFYKLCQR